MEAQIRRVLQVLLYGQHCSLTGLKAMAGVSKSNDSSWVPAAAHAGRTHPCWICLPLWRPRYAGSCMWVATLSPCQHVALCIEKANLRRVKSKASATAAAPACCCLHAEVQDPAAIGATSLYTTSRVGTATQIRLSYGPRPLINPAADATSGVS